MLLSNEGKITGLWSLNFGKIVTHQPRTFAEKRSYINPGGYNDYYLMVSTSNCLYDTLSPHSESIHWVMQDLNTYVSLV